MGRLLVKFAALTAAGLIAALGVTAAPAAKAQPAWNHGEFTVVADHLNNPRGLSPAPWGGLYLAEAGAGGSTCVGSGSNKTCVGLTGSLDLVRGGWAGAGVKRIVTGLISASGPGGLAAEGPVSVSRGPWGPFFGLFGESSHAVPPPGVLPASLRAAALAQLGHLWLVRGHGRVRNVSDVGDQDWTWTSTRVFLAPHDFPDSNPNAVLYSRGRLYVANAGSNLLDRIGRSGKVKVRVFFPVPKGSPNDSVPTCVAGGTGKAPAVGGRLCGSHTPRKDRSGGGVPGHAPKVWATGLTTVQGCGFGRDGAFYATEFQTGGLDATNPAGDVVRIDRYGHRTHLGVGKLFDPSGFAAGPDGAIYVSNCSLAPATGMGPKLCPTGGQVVRIAQD